MKNKQNYPARTPYEMLTQEKSSMPLRYTSVHFAQQIAGGLRQVLRREV